MAFDHTFKRVARVLFPSCEVRPEKVGDLPLEIDIVVRCPERAPDTFTIPVMERRFSTHNIIEFKSDRDKRRGTDLSKLIAYAGLYCHHHGIDLRAMRVMVTAWYVTALRPAFLDGLLGEGIATTGGAPGMYDLSQAFPCPCHVVACNELDDTVENAPLRMLGTKSTRRSALVRLHDAKDELHPGMEKVISLICLLYHDEVKDMSELDNWLPADMRRSVVHAIEDIGIEETVNAVGIDKVINAVGIDKVINAVGIDKVKKAIASIEARLKQE